MIDQHLVIDCDTGETITVPLTPEELAQREADAAAAQAAEQARQQAIADAEAQHRTDAENVMALFPNATPEQVQSFLRLANVTL